MQTRRGAKRLALSLPSVLQDPPPTRNVSQITNERILPSLCADQSLGYIKPPSLRFRPVILHTSMNCFPHRSAVEIKINLDSCIFYKLKCPVCTILFGDVDPTSSSPAQPNTCHRLRPPPSSARRRSRQSLWYSEGSSNVSLLRPASQPSLLLRSRQAKIPIVLFRQTWSASNRCSRGR